jgi:hypothetical protein
MSEWKCALCQMPGFATAGVPLLLKDAQGKRWIGECGPHPKCGFAFTTPEMDGFFKLGEIIGWMELP